MPGIVAAKPIETTEHCIHGCGYTARYINKKGGLICSPYSNSCPAVKNKNSLALSKAHREGRMSTDHLSEYRAWNKGLTKDTDVRVAKIAATQSGIRKITDSKKIEKKSYYEKCKFNIQSSIKRIEGFDLLEKYGMYDRIKNPTGVVRDHIISIAYGFKHNIDPSVISHPANCRFILHKDNARKSSLNGCTLNELYIKIEKWDVEGNTVYLTE